MCLKINPIKWQNVWIHARSLCGMKIRIIQYVLDDKTIIVRNNDDGNLLSTISMNLMTFLLFKN